VKIGVDYSSVVQGKTGIGMAAQNLVQAMKKEASGAEFLLYSASGGDLNTPGRIFWESVRLPMKARHDRLDILYSPGFAPPMWSPAPSVVTVHDLIGMAYPENQGPVSGFYWSRWLPAAVRRARRVIASSEHTRRDISRFLNIKPERVSVVPLAANPVFKKDARRPSDEGVLEKFGIRKPFFISVGTLEPRKNHLRLLEAYDILKQKRLNSFMLVIVGKTTAAEKVLKTFVRAKELEKDVIFLGYVGLEELICLYNAALGYAITSLYEGFGLPVLEAMSCGLSGVCSDRSSLPEVAGESALMVDPENPGEIAEALRRYSEDAVLRRSLSQAALERAGQFSMANVARQMLEIFKDEIEK